MSNLKKLETPLGENFYLPSLDGLRFFAFFFVFLHHSLQTITSNNPFLDFLLIAFKKNGWVGVDLFFILSGFLITLLLLKEREKNGKFSFKNFYIRRSLRIWPLYFLALIFGYFINPLIFKQLFNQDFFIQRNIQEYFSQLPFYFTFLGNWAVFKYNYSSFPTVSHLWTISIEEQFYLVWPIILYFLTSFKKGFIATIIIVFTALILRIYLVFLNFQHPTIYVNTFTRMDTLVWGSLLAFMFFYRQDFLARLKPILKLPFQILAITILIYLLYRLRFFDNIIPRNAIFGYWLIGFFMSYFLISALNIGSSFSKFLSKQYVVFLGKISYGLYVWHILAIEFSKNILGEFKFLLPIMAFILTIVLASISYYLYEIQFLKLKKQFTSVKARSI